VIPYNKTLKTNARSLRANMTDAERIIWQRVRRKQILGVQFYRQKPIGRYIVDFYASKAKLVVEIDGAQHVEPVNMEKDQQRDLFMQQQGLEVLRFDNGAVLTQLNDVLEEIYRVVEQRINLPQPLFDKEGSYACAGEDGD